MALVNVIQLKKLLSELWGIQFYKQKIRVFKRFVLTYRWKLLWTLGINAHCFNFGMQRQSKFLQKTLYQASTELFLIPAEFSWVQDVVSIVIILLFYKTVPLYLEEFLCQ